jgi:hypothetical protein
MVFGFRFGMWGISGYHHDMTRERKRHTSIWLTAIAIALVLLGAYVGGYFWLGEYEVDRVLHDGAHWRVYSSSEIKACYRPMAWCECRVRGESVVLGSRDGGGMFPPEDMFDPP